MQGLADGVQAHLDSIKIGPKLRHEFRHSYTVQKPSDNDVRRWVSDPPPTVIRMKIDCNTCTVRGAACSDCVVSFLTVPLRPGLVEVDDSQAAALSALAGGGLVPPLRLVRPGERAS